MGHADLAYADRRHAGRMLAAHLLHLQAAPGLMVLALPRGGVAVAFEVALALAAPLDVFLVRKLGHPANEEVAVGAIAAGGVEVLDEDAPTGAHFAAIRQREAQELMRRERLYRGNAGPLALAGRTVVLVDDGLATGASMRAAVLGVRQQAPMQVCVAVPVGPADTCDALRALADEVVCPAMPQPFRAVSLWYRDFPQATDEEVQALLRAAQQR